MDRQLRKEYNRAVAAKNAVIERMNPPKAVVPDAPELEEVLALINEYNDVEMQQRGRLEKIYAFFAALPGSEVEFTGGDKWGINDFNDARTGQSGMIMQRLIGNKVHHISAVKPGRKE